MSQTLPPTFHLRCALLEFYRLEKTLYDECLNGIPAYTNCLLIGIDNETRQREIAYFVPQGALFDKKTLIELFYKPYTYEAIFFDTHFENIPLFALPGISIFKIYSMGRIDELCKLIRLENNNDYFFKGSIISTALETTMLYALRHLKEDKPSLFEYFIRQFDNERLPKLLSYIHSHLKEDLSLEQMADVIFLSPDYASQFFKKYVGIGLQSYLIDQRVKKGLYYLITSMDQISAISEKTGFSDQAYFNRRFKALFKLSPLPLRKRYHILQYSQAGALMA